MTSIKREAIKDADEYAKAKMFYGEGAGIRRRLINQTVQFKIANIPGYDAAFQQELSKQDFAKLSRSARRERRRIDALATANKNGKALVRGDFRALSLPILALVGVGYVAHQTGYDKKALHYTQREVNKARVWTVVRYDKWRRRHDDKVRQLGATGPLPHAK